MARGRIDHPELIGTALLMRVGTTACATAIAGATAFVSEQIVTLALR
jgi:hypothetical protein